MLEWRRANFFGGLPVGLGAAVEPAEDGQPVLSGSRNGNVPPVNGPA